MPTATIHTNKGSFTVRLLPDHAPKTVENFVGLASGSKEWKDPRDGQTKSTALYPGTIFHRVIHGFMVQGGDPTGTGMGGPGYQFEDEVDGPHRFDRPGYLAMANAGPGTNGSQFFITQVPTPWLDGKHTIFGEVVDDESKKVVDAIATAKTAPGDRPIEPILIDHVVIERKNA
jgi:peptidyl-prolyl cis-trans isomerase A (cyclophilin A)